MYKRILLPTDGSEASQRAIQSGVDFARSIGAEVVAMSATPEFHALSANAEMLEQTRDEFLAASRASGQRLLDQAAAVARDAGVPCTVVQAVSDEPYEAIIAAARDRQCDLIVMGSHGRRGLSRLLARSVTQGVLAYAPAPLMVLRPPLEEGGAGRHSMAAA